MVGKNLYSLPVTENGITCNYHCLVVSAFAPTCSWVLVRGGTVLSTGVVEDEDIGVMLKALQTDLNGQSAWKKQTLH